MFPSTTTTTEELKKSVFNSNPKKFGLEPSLNPICSHKILYYRLPIHEGPHGFFRGNKCKIDLVIPGIMELPHLSSSDVHRINDIPVLPFFILVLQKLQGWDDRRMMYTYPKKLARAPVDARDVQQLLMTPGLAQIGSAKRFIDEGVLTPSFISKSRVRICSFCESFPRFRDQLLCVWNSMGDSGANCNNAFPALD